MPISQSQKDLCPSLNNVRRELSGELSEGAPGARKLGVTGKPAGLSQLPLAPPRDLCPIRRAPVASRPG
ncbi:hypothetical protein CGMCC3_g13917 [Colletotrichum fructicola]|nr:uncharacterized protein CGMCC3_g13917 [Colletotrichum fructicola]KAE9569977.1 hypothetical protein CGMCC3_g13917 [Colletotrichum fructicola]